MPAPRLERTQEAIGMGHGRVREFRTSMSRALSHRQEFNGRSIPGPSRNYVDDENNILACHPKELVFFPLIPQKADEILSVADSMQIPRAKVIYSLDEAETRLSYNNRDTRRVLRQFLGNNGFSDSSMRPLSGGPVIR